MKHEDGAFKVKIEAACGMFPALRWGLKNLDGRNCMIQ
jgi:hypothetical protein